MNRDQVITKRVEQFFPEDQKFMFLRNLKMRHDRNHFHRARAKNPELVPWDDIVVYEPEVVVVYDRKYIGPSLKWNKDNECIMPPYEKYDLLLLGFTRPPEKIVHVRRSEITEEESELIHNLTTKYGYILVEPNNYEKLGFKLSNKGDLIFPDIKVDREKDWFAYKEAFDELYQNLKTYKNKNFSSKEAYTKV